MKKEWFNESAKEFLTTHRQQVLKYILGEMLKISNRGIIPDWEIFARSDEWKRLIKLMNKENQFMFKNLWRQVFRDTMPGPVP